MIKKFLTVDDQLHATLWEIFRAGMERIDRLTPFKQGLNKAEFDPMMRDPAFIKLVLYSHDEPVGVALVATDISKLEWLSMAYFRDTYDEIPIYYMVGIAVSEAYSIKCSTGGRTLIMAALEELPPEGAFIYDFSCSIHASLSSFGQLITKDAGRVRMLDAVEYWEIKHIRKSNERRLGTETRTRFP